MTERNQRAHSPFKAKVALAALKVRQDPDATHRAANRPARSSEMRPDLSLCLITSACTAGMDSPYPVEKTPSIHSENE